MLITKKKTILKNQEISAKKRSKKKFWKTDNFIGYLFMIPTIIGFSIFVVYPLIFSAKYALMEWDGLTTPIFVGLDNFKYLLTKDPVFIKTLVATFKYVLLTVPANLIFGLLLAVLLNKKLKGIKVFRTIYYLPVVLPSVASLILWKFIYASDYGLLNQILNSMGLKPVEWLTSSKMAMVSIAITVIWGVGSQMIIFLSGLQSVPAEVYEASNIDGCGRIRQFFSITLPLITPVLFLQLITGIINSFQAYNQIAILTKGGPEYSTNVLGYSIVQSAFVDNDYGYALAQVWILIAIIMVFTIIIYQVSYKKVYYEAD